MIFFDRTTMESIRPKSLTDPKYMNSIKRAIAEHMTLDVDRREQTDIPLVWKTPFQADVLRALKTVSGGACAFCEMEVPLSVYRFRPPAYAKPKKPLEGDASYLWLSFELENLFPICAECRPTDQSYFPVIGNRAEYPSIDVPDEKPQLIYPGELSRPYQHFSVDSGGQLRGLTKRARLTIHHFKLNSRNKIDAREERLKRFVSRMLAEKWSSELTPSGTSDGSWYLYLRRIAEQLVKRSGPRRPLSPLAIHTTMERISKEDGFDAWLSDALENIDSEDAAKSDDSVGESIDPAKSSRNATTFARRIDSVELKTYKSLEHITFKIAADLSRHTRARLTANMAMKSNMPEAPCVLILGENATGKSSILEAIALTLMPAEQRELLDLETEKLTLNPEYMGQTDAKSVASSFVNITFHPAAGSEEPPSLALEIDGNADADRPFKESGNRSVLVPPVFAYGAHRLYGSSQQYSSLRHIETLFYNDRQLPKPEKWLCELSSENLKQVARALRHIIQIDGDFETIEVDRAANQCKINILKTQANGDSYTVPQRMDIVSSGYRAIFALVCDVLEGLMAHTGGEVAAARETPAIVLIDEIEAHLHPRWKLHVITGLRQALPKVTFIMTSHDPLCVRGMYNGEVLALNRYQNTDKDGLGMPERVEPVGGFENVETLTVEQLLTSELFQLFSTDNPELDRSFAQVADNLSQTRESADPTSEAVTELDRILTTALPYGQTELARIVQEAVAEFLAERRKRDSDANAKSRNAAKEKIKKRLRDLMQ